MKTEIEPMKDNTVFWKMRNGKLISVDDMDINHLRNALKMIIRNREKALKLFEAKSKVEFKLNGDMAQLFNDDMEQYEIEMEAGITDIETGIM